MKQRFYFFIRYFLYWLIFFTFARLFFMSYEFSQTTHVKLSEWWGILIRGAWMDISLIGYVLLLSSLFMAFLFFVEKKWLVRVFDYYTIFLLAIFSFVIVSDAELYRNWGFRIDATPLLYLKTPEEAMASVKPLLIIALIALTVLIFILFFILFRKKVLNSKMEINRGKWWYIPVFVFFSATMIIPIRGNFGIASMNPGKVYFSQNMYCNHAALNSVWNMVYSLTKSNSMYKKYPNYIDKTKAKEISSELMRDNGTTTKVLNTERPNVVIILLESFTGKLIEPLGGLPGITPNLNRLSKEGIFFNRIYASGDRSDKGIVAVVSGFPAQPTKSIIKYPLKSQKLATISGVLDSVGYTTTFYYGGNPDFANIRSYLFSSKFRRLVTQDDFPKSYRNSKWGVHDEYMFKRFMVDCDSAKSPFFKMFFTLTSHEPYEVPGKPKFAGNDGQTKFLSTAYYTDSCIGAFFNEARTKEWYKNTLFILIADHGHRYPGNDPNYVLSRYRIPMLWLGGALSKTGLTISSTASQSDLAATLLNQLGFNTKKFILSRNILSSDFKPFAYYVFNDGFGFVKDSAAIIFDHTSRKIIVREGQNTDKVAEQGFSFLSYYQDIFLGL